MPDPESDQPPTPPEGLQLIMEAGTAGGVYANFAQVAHSPFEFTIDFVRLDFTQNPLTGIVVARVSLSPLMVSQLIQALDSNWSKYAAKALPPEVYQDANRDQDGPEADPSPGEP